MRVGFVMTAIVAAVAGAAAALMLAGGGVVGSADAQAGVPATQVQLQATDRVARAGARQARANRRALAQLRALRARIPVAWARVNGFETPSLGPHSPNVLGVERCDQDPSGCYVVGLRALPADADTACMGMLSAQGSTYGLFEFFGTLDEIQIATFDNSGPDDGTFNMTIWCS